MPDFLRAAALVPRLRGAPSLNVHDTFPELFATNSAAHRAVARALRVEEAARRSWPTRRHGDRRGADLLTSVASASGARSWS